MSTLNMLEKINLVSILDERGNLDVAELGHLLNFRTKRIYYISGVPSGESRGSHAHKSLQQAFFALSGNFTLRVSNGKETEKVILSAHSVGYFLNSGFWRVLEDFSPDAVCLVLASEAYNPHDYIHSFSEYVEWRESL